MLLDLELSPQAETYLRRRAAVDGKDLAACVSELVERVVGRSSLDEMLAPLRAEFERSCTSDEELVAQITAARDEYRAQR